MLRKLAPTLGKLLTILGKLVTTFHFQTSVEKCLTITALVAPVLRDAARLSQRYPPIARYGVFGVSRWPIGCDTPSPFSECFPLGEHAKWRSDTPYKRGLSAILARYHMKTREMGAIHPSAILSRIGIAQYGRYLALGR